VTSPGGTAPPGRAGRRVGEQHPELGVTDAVEALLLAAHPRALGILDRAGEDHPLRAPDVVDDPVAGDREDPRPEPPEVGEPTDALGRGEEDVLGDVGGGVPVPQLPGARANTRAAERS
jgi:hypothetical protein